MAVEPDAAVSELDSLTVAASTDLIPIVDVSDTTESLQGTTKNITKDNLLNGLALDSELDAHVEDTNNPHSVTKAQVGLSEADNTSDADKPVSTATQSALDGKANAGETGVDAFIELTDAPSSYAGQGGKIVKVKVTADGLEFGEGGGGAVDSVNGQTGEVVLDSDDISDVGKIHKFSTGTNTGDETASTIKTKLEITTLSGSNTGDQDLSGKVDKVTGKGLSTNDFTTAEQSKLSEIEAGADVTDATNVAAAGAFMTSNVIDEDDMNSNSDTKVPTQQSVVSYVATHSGSGSPKGLKLSFIL